MPNPNSDPAKVSGRIESIVDPASIDASGDAAPREPEGKPYTRRSDGKFAPGNQGPRRSHAKKEAAGTSLDLSAAAGLFVAINGMLAMGTGNPELAMTDDDGARFALAWSNVLRHYNVATTQKTFDWIMAGGITATLYIPRVHAINQRRRAEAVARRARPMTQPGAVVYPFAVQNPSEPTIQ
jgi:hypothetical protein